jgi:hypothetical protein
LPFIEDNSVDCIVGMSVFDQNPTGMMPAIAKEFRRILKPGGRVAYLHNEEVNLPAVFASYLGLAEPRYLIPSPHWHPTNDIEFCHVSRAELDAALGAAGSQCKILPQYLKRLTPPSNPAQKQVHVPLSSVMTPQNLQLMQREAAGLQQTHSITLQDIATSQLIGNLVEGHLFSTVHGFDVLSGGVFEVQLGLDWQQCFASRPNETCFARGITRFGVASRERLPARSEYRQELNQLPEPSAPQDILLTAYQYGLLARKV